MGEVEKVALKKRRLRVFERTLLVAALAGGLLVIGGAPSPMLLNRYFKQRRNDARLKYQGKTVLNRLERQGLIYCDERNGKQYARTTKRGEQLLAISNGMQPHRPKRWDKRWRVVLFDIPERRRKTRDSLRHFMSDYGFVRLQDSAWVYPYDCEDLIALAKAHYRLGASVLYMVVEEIENDVHLRNHFSLS